MPSQRAGSQRTAMRNDPSLGRFAQTDTIVPVQSQGNQTLFITCQFFWVRLPKSMHNKNLTGLA